ncbi:hypothetical protein K502DRAFT_343116 [Neoconidiobolus thromboides FSU 785]|nr:hypothetical protein K502DRAFT_343116 [Neoconidiobolus thromboides FSU 785]
MIITTTKSSGSNNNEKKTHGPTLSSTVLGFLGLTTLYPGGAKAFLGHTLNATRAAKMTRIASITCIYALSSNLLEEYRTNKNAFDDDDNGHDLIHHKPQRKDDMWNPIFGSLLAGAVLQARSRVVKNILKSSGFFGIGMGLYCIGLDWLEPIIPLKNFDLVQSLNNLLDPTASNNRK